MNPLMKPERVKTALSLAETVTGNGRVILGNPDSLNLVEELAANFDFNSNTSAGLEGFYQSFIDSNELLDEVGGAVYDTVVDKYAAIFKKLVSFTRERVVPFISDVSGQIIANYPEGVAYPKVVNWTPALDQNVLGGYLVARYGSEMKSPSRYLYMKPVATDQVLARFDAGRFLTLADKETFKRRSSPEQYAKVHRELFENDSFIESSLFSKSYFIESLDSIVIALQLVEYYKSHEEHADDAELNLDEYHRFLDVVTDSLLIRGQDALKAFIRACDNGLIVLSGSTSTGGAAVVTLNGALENAYFVDANGTIEAIHGYVLSGENGPCSIQSLADNQDYFYRVYRDKFLDLKDLELYHVRNYVQSAAIEVCFKAVNAFKGTTPELDSAYAQEVKDYLQRFPVQSKDETYRVCRYVITNIVLKQPLIDVILTEYNIAADHNELSSRELGTLALMAVVVGWLKEQVVLPHIVSID